MNRTTKRICLYVAIFLALEIALLIGWNLLRSNKPSAAVPAETTAEKVTSATEQELVVQTAATEETAAPKTTADETVPETTVPEATEAETKQDETVPEETRPEETVAEEATSEETTPAESAPAETEPVVLSFDTVPQYYQNDYPDARYGTTDIARSGSGITALAMVASYMTEHAYYPDELADYVAHFIGNHYERLEFGSDLLQLSWKRAVNIHELLAGVKEGNVGIILLNEKSVFSSSHHYLVLTGVNEEGLITLLDPDKNHYSSKGIDAYLENGIKEGFLYSGYEGGWLYDKSAMPEEPFIYTPEPRAEVCRYPDLELSEYELNLLADLIWMEGQSEPFEGQQAIAEVVLNRLLSGKFGSNIYNIVHAPNQFESVPYLYKATPTYTQYKAIERAVYGPYILPEDVVFYAKFSVNKNVWGKIGAHTFCYGY